MFCADFHVHSTFSDGRLTIPQIVDLYGSRGFGAVAVTDHLCESSTLLGKAARYLEQTLTRESFPLYLRILASEARRAWSTYGMVLLPGAELTKNSVRNHRSAHLVALGMRRFVAADPDPLEIAHEIHAQGGVVIAAHPVHTRKREKQTYELWDRRAELCRAFDAWEVASGPHLFAEVLASGLPMIASSDLHRPGQITSWKTVLGGPRDPESILQEIRQQRLRFLFYREGWHDDRRTLLRTVDDSLHPDDLWHHLGASWAPDGDDSVPRAASA